MPSLPPSLGFTLCAVLVVAFLASPTVAFGAGNIGERAEDWLYEVVIDLLCSLHCPD